MIQRALSRPVSTLIGAGSIAVLGGFALARLPVSLLPALERPRLVVTARAAGHSREEILRGITEPLERRLASLPSLASLRSETKDGQARLVVETEWQTDPDLVRIEAGRRVEGALEPRPDELTLAVLAGDPAPVVEIAVTGGGSAAARGAFARDVLLPDLARLPGAGRVETVGASASQVVVRPQAALLAARGLTAEDVVARLRSVGRPLAAGRVRDGGALRELLVGERPSSIEEVRALAIASPLGPVPLGEVARAAVEEVGDGSSFRANGKEGVLLRLYRAPGANAVSLASQARARLREWAPPAGITADIVADRSREVLGAASELALAAAAGVLLGTLVLRALLGRWNPTLALSVVIPVSLLGAFTVFPVAGIPLDVVSLSGLALAAGMLVDNSIVVLESIEAARAAGSTEPRLAGTRQVAVAVATSTAATVVVFLPLLYLRGLARAFFGEQAIAVTAALAASLLLSLTLTPVLAGRKGAGAGRHPGRDAYRRLLARVLDRPRAAIAIGAGAALVTLAAGALLPRALFPEGESRRISVALRFPADASPESAERLARGVEGAIDAALHANGTPPRRVLASRGAAADTTDVADGAEKADSTRARIELEFETPADAARARPLVLAAVSRVPGAEARVRAVPAALADAVRPGAFVVASALDEEGARALGARVAAHVRRAAHVALTPEEDDRPRESLVLAWDAARVGGRGTDAAEVARVEAQLRSSLGDLDAGRAALPGAEREIRVAPTLPAEPAVLPLRAREGAVPLAALARFSRELRPARALREEARPAVRLEAAVGSSRARDASSLARAIASVPIAAGERVSAGGELLEMVRAFSELKLALALSVVLVFLLLSAVYESPLLPFAVLAATPVAAGGAFALLAVTGQGLNVLSLLGLVLLVGIVSNHTILLVDRVEQLRRERVPERQALERAASERYRPVLMTTATTFLGMLPLALFGGEGVELRRALATAVLGGLVTSTFASLLLVPVLHLALEPLRRRALP